MPWWKGEPDTPRGDERATVKVGAIRDTVLAAAEAFRFRPGNARSELDALHAMRERAGTEAVDDAVVWWVDRGLDRAWSSGWQPADVLRFLRRSLSPAHAEAVSPLVAASGRRRPEALSDHRWSAQVTALSGESSQQPGLGAGSMPMGLAVEAVSVLLHLPSLPRLSSSGGGAKSSVGGKAGVMLERVRALLAKAESTTFPEEAEALTAKAQQLMARHAIDEAMVVSGRGSSPPTVAGWRIGVDDPYASAKSVLLGRIAHANRCRSVWSRDFGFSTVFGDQSDLAMVELLFTSLLVQGTDAMLRAGPSVDRWGRSRTRSFRQSFLLAYAHRIGERLAATAASVVAEGTARHGVTLLPVLASRAEAVDEAVHLAYPRLASRETSVTNYAGWVAGRAAAERASFSVGGELATG